MSNFGPYDQDEFIKQYSKTLKHTFDECVKNPMDGVDCSKNYEKSQLKYLGEIKEKNIYNKVDHLLQKLNVDSNGIVTERIKSALKENSELRDGLELRLQNLYGKRDMRLRDVNTIMDASVYANLMWTLIATSSLYFIFLYK